MVGLINNLEELLIVEKSVRLAYLGKDEAKIHIKMAKLIQDIGQTNDIDLIIKAEEAINIHIYKYYNNSVEIDGSIKQTLAEIQYAKIMIDIIKNQPEHYRIMAKTYNNPKNKIMGLPKDEAIQFFKSQFVRFNNMSKVDLSNEKKMVISARKINIHIANEIYFNMQKDTLVDKSDA